MYIPTVYTNTMTQSTVFKNNKTQAVRIPKSMAFPDSVKKVKITRRDGSLVITAIDDSWEAYMNGPRLDDDFERPPQPEPRKREEW
jgi:antitoxin VapB